MMLDVSYPVGSIYITTDLKNPAETLGGEWVSYGEGRTLIGAGTGTDTNNEERTFAVNDTGGEYKHTLTINEMPSHKHNLAYRSQIISNGNSGTTIVNPGGTITRLGWK